MSTLLYKMEPNPSPQQYEILLAYMEQHRDLNNSHNTKGRIVRRRRWEKLVALLNSEISGFFRTTRQWKKVWHIIKKNSKRKAARLHRAASGTGGGSETIEQLNDVDKRVLIIIGAQTATGFAMDGANCAEEIVVEPVEEQQALSTDPDGRKDIGASTCAPAPEPSQPDVHLEKDSCLQNAEVVNVPASQSTSCTPHPESVPQTLPAPSEHSTHHQAFRPQLEISPYALMRARGQQASMSYSEQAAQQLPHRPAVGRDYRERQQHRDNTDLKRKQDRDRQVEQQVQKEYKREQNRIREIRAANSKRLG